MHPSLGLVIERFPYVEDRAMRLFERDETFRELCEDYQACAATVERLEASPHSSREIRNEYSALVLRLERELLRYLEEHPCCGGGS
jgi:hypothetical protein